MFLTCHLIINLIEDDNFVHYIPIFINEINGERKQFVKNIKFINFYQLLLGIHY